MTRKEKGLIEELVAIAKRLGETKYLHIHNYMLECTLEFDLDTAQNFYTCRMTEDDIETGYTSTKWCQESAVNWFVSSLDFAHAVTLVGNYIGGL